MISDKVFNLIFSIICAGLGVGIYSAEDLGRYRFFGIWWFAFGILFLYEGIR